MKVAIAQIRPFSGDIARNVTIHRRFAEAAAARKAALVLFPELSLTGYEPSLAREIATGADDNRLRELQYVCDRRNIAIAAGLPTMNERGVLISMVIFRPGHSRLVYSKQLLHPDEVPFFVAGRDVVQFSIGGLRVAPAICYESLRAGHVRHAAGRRANVYMASVAKHAHGIEKARVHYSAIAVAHHMHVIMCNSVGACDNFTSAGCSAIWGPHGRIQGELTEQEGLLVTDLATGNSVALDDRFQETRGVEPEISSI